ncbi:DUF563 domain-containing protein [Paenibacillus chartarius]|uniref:DUF563 domain-containing protein n=1 Tax=Paenibacillus chartarius TaxID=747481 RepID=A0ABV6DMR0_9BACL
MQTKRTRGKQASNTRRNKQVKSIKKRTKPTGGRRKKTKRRNPLRQTRSLKLKKKKKKAARRRRKASSPQPAVLIEPGRPVRYADTAPYVSEWIHNGNKDCYFTILYPDQSRYFATAKAIHAPEFHETNQVWGHSFAAVIPQGRMWGPHGHVITADNTLLSDVSLDFPTGKNPEFHPAMTNWEPYPLMDTSGTVAALAFCTADNYWHWLYDVLTRIHLLRVAGIHVDKYAVNLSSSRPFQLATLYMLGIQPEQIILAHPQFHLRAEKLAVASAQENQNYPQWTIDWLREELLYKQNLHTNIGAGNERIYISRGNQPRRRIENEQEIMDLLSAYGFRICALEDIPVEQQIQLFHSAQVIVAPHGAGLANLTFCRPQTRVLELFGENFKPNLYWKLSNMGGLDYYHLICRSVGPSDTGYVGDENIYVDRNHLEQSLQFMGL